MFGTKIGKRQISLLDKGDTMMTEKEIIKHAKDYIDSLANGTNPLTGEPVNESDVVNNVRIARCLFYVSGILEKVLNGERNILPRVKKSKFSISAEKLEDFEYSSEPILVSDVVKRIAFQIHPHYHLLADVLEIDFTYIVGANHQKVQITKNYNIKSPARQAIRNCAAGNKE